MTATIQYLSPASVLPRPAQGRMRPLRAGIRNVWEYDDQQFWFADGRLILRGQNTAGKSKALELLLPFVLDGDIRSERLDPFGSRAKTMYWNLIDFAERASAIGYCWVEFGHLDPAGVERYVTCVVGLRAVRSAGRKVDTWFAVTPQRVGADLDLAPGGVPLTEERFRAALEERSVYSTSARDHRAAVDHALFGLGPDRYGALIHLLLQLRRPKLSEKLDMARLGEYLSDALPPLERHRMEQLASAFARLDEDTAEIERLEASSTQLHAFLGSYRAHAQVQARLRADAVRAANTRFDNVTETERQQRAERDQATESLGAIEGRRAELASAIERMTGQLGGLDLSKVHALHEVEKSTDKAEEYASLLVGRAGRDRDSATTAGTAAAEAEQVADGAARRRDDEAAATLDAAEEAQLGPEHRMHAEQLLAAPDRAVVALGGVADRRQALLRAVREAADQAAAALARIHADERSHRAAEGALAEAEAAEAAQHTTLDAAATALAEAVEAWAVDWQVPLPDGHADAVVDEVQRGGRPAAGPLLAPARASLTEQRVVLGTERQQGQRRRDEADRERRLVEAETDDAPPPRPGRPEARPDGCAPLWASVDFAAGLEGDHRAGLEAALEASGLLDALVSPEGRLLDPDTLDTWVAVPPGSEATDDASARDPGTAGRGDTTAAGSAASGAAAGSDGLAGLVPVPSGPLEAAAVARALAAAVAGGALVATDGSWSIGPLRGRWSKPAPEYIGAAARAEARARRIAALTAEIEALDGRLADLAEQEAVLATELRRLDQAESAWPSTDALRDAGRDLARAVSTTGRARTQLAEAGQRLDRSRSEGQGAIDALADAEVRAGCQAALLDAAFEALSRYRNHLVGLAAAVREAATARTSAASAGERARAAEEVAARSEAEGREATAVATTARGEADELRRTSGADADAVLARHRELTAALELASGERDQLDEDRDGARDRLKAATVRLETTEEERRQRDDDRAQALKALARLAATELAALAFGPVDPDRDLTQVTAGLGFARSVHDRLREVAVDQAAQDSVSNRFHNGMTTLRSQLGSDFDPYLDTSDGIEVCFATLNGAPVGATELSSALDEQIRRRRETLSDEERELIERHLLTEVGTHLGERVHAAWSLQNRMNEQLHAHPTRSGVTLRLSWDVAPDAGAGAEQAVKLLRREVALLDQSERVALAAFLAERVRAAREDGEGADAVERLAAALDYRRWHRFSIHRRAEGREERMTARTQAVGSGGEQAKLAHLPLFAATSAYYASARPDAPHLLMLDEAFAGIDDSQRGDCMGMLVDLDLDMVLTNYAEWGFYAEVPSLAVYHLERTPGHPGVTALRFVWDGQTRREDDPWLDAKIAGSDADGDGLFSG
ncbi:MAG TPA: TIGR02680 family protein [Acidimicrobiales bacterium]|nr:TIGR02680 family protein [Acidimicrobiales bacterium]